MYTSANQNQKLTDYVVKCLRALRVMTGLRAISVMILNPLSIMAIMSSSWKLLMSVDDNPVPIRLFATQALTTILGLSMIIESDDWDTMYTFLSRLCFLLPSLILGMTMSIVFNISKLCLKQVVKSIDNFSLFQKQRSNVYTLYSDEPFMKIAWGLDDSIDKLREIHLELYDNIKRLNSYLSDTLFFIMLCCRIGAFADLYYFFRIGKHFLFRYSLTNVFIIFSLCAVSSSYSDMEEKLNNAISQLDFRVFGEKKKLELELLQLQVDKMRVNFSAMKLFNLNLSFLITVLTTTIGYMMILKQLGA